MLVWVGWLGLVFEAMVGPSQLIKLVKTQQTRAISKWVYIYLTCALTCYLIYAISIANAVFIVANAVGIVINLTVLGLLLRYRRRGA